MTVPAVQDLRQQLALGLLERFASRDVASLEERSVRVQEVNHLLRVLRLALRVDHQLVARRQLVEQRTHARTRLHQQVAHATAPRVVHVEELQRGELRLGLLHPRLVRDLAEPLVEARDGVVVVDRVDQRQVEVDDENQLLVLVHGEVGERNHVAIALLRRGRRRLLLLRRGGNGWELGDDGRRRRLGNRHHFLLRSKVAKDVVDLLLHVSEEQGKQRSGLREGEGGSAADA